MAEAQQEPEKLKSQNVVNLFLLGRTLSDTLVPEIHEDAEPTLRRRRQRLLTFDTHDLTKLVTDSFSPHNFSSLTSSPIRVVSITESRHNYRVKYVKTTCIEEFRFSL